MQGYRPFTHDVESITLSDDDMAAFARVVQELCHLHVQHEVSQKLSSVGYKWNEDSCDYLQGRARFIWKTAIVSRDAKAEEAT